MLVVCLVLSLRAPRRRLAGAERGSCVVQDALKSSCCRVRAAEHAPCNPFRVLERRDGLAEMVERGGGVQVERPRVIHPDPERGYIRRSENAWRHGNQFAQQRPG